MNAVAQLHATQRTPCSFTRLAMSLARHKGDFMAAQVELADDDAMFRILKSAIGAGTISDANWASELSDFARLSGEFASRLRPATILGKLRGMRPVPPNTRTIREASGGGGGWVAAGNPTPLSQYDLDEISLGVSKMQGGIVLTDEMTRTANAASLAWLEQLMIRTLAALLDAAFIDPTLTAGDGPASATNGATPTQSTGSSAAQATADLKAMVQKLIDAGSDLSNATFVLHPRTALALSLMLNTGNQFAFPSITALGGSLLGLPAITSAAVPIDTGADTYISLIDASRILVADDGLAAVDVSWQSSVQLVTDPATGAQTMVSLWANNLVGVRLTRWISWKVLDSSAIAVLEDVTY